MNSLSAAGSSAASSARKRGHVSRRPRLPGHSSVAEPLGKGPKFADRFDVMVLPASLRCPVVIRHRSETRHAAKMLPSGWCGHAARARTPSSPGAEMTRPVPSTEKLGIGRAGLQASRWPLVHHIVDRDTLVFDDVPRSTGSSAWCALGNLIANCGHSRCRRLGEGARSDACRGRARQRCRCGERGPPERALSPRDSVSRQELGTSLLGSAGVNPGRKVACT